MTIKRATAIAAGLVLLAGSLLGGCSPAGTAVGAAAGVGVTAAQERGLGTAIDDQTIRLGINDRWFQHSAEMHRKLSLQVQEGRVLITGSVPSQDMRLQAVRLAWQVEGVKEVINEIEVAESGGIDGYALDTWISTELKTRLLFDRDVFSINYSIETVKQVVYLMGVAQDEAELQRAIEHARNVSYVRRVVSYVRLKDDPARQAGS